MNDTITLTIDGKEVSVLPGTTIFDAARAHGIEIPALCYHPKLRPIGSCRLCLVEIEGYVHPVTSCNTEVSPHTQVITQSEKLVRLRKQAVESMVTDHPLDCPVCDKAGECQLQDLVYEFGIIKKSFTKDVPLSPIDYLSPLVERNNRRCVRCGRCISVCNEIQGEMAIEWTTHDGITEILPRGGYPLNCEFCGQCIAICPVGALMNRLFKYKARVWELKKIRSVCPYCGGGCAIELNVRKNKVMRVTSSYHETHNQGNLCGRGNFGFNFVNNNNRVHTPLIKRRKDHLPVFWEEVLGSAAEHLKKIYKSFGPDSIAGLGSCRASNEDNYVFQKFFRATIGTNNIDSPAHFSYRNIERGLRETLGIHARPHNFRDLENTPVIFVLGADVRGECPPAALKIMRAARFQGSTLVVANPRQTKLDTFAHLSLRYRPGTELFLIAGIMKAILEKSLVQEKEMEKILHFFALKESLDRKTLEDIAAVTSLSRDQIHQVAEILGKGKTGKIVFGYNVVTHAQGKDVVGALGSLAFLTGMIDHNGDGLIPLIAKNNVYGMLDMGVMPDLLPGYQGLENSASFEMVWGKPLPREPGKTAEEMLAAILDEKIKALYIMGCDPLVDFPQTDKWEEALDKLEWLAVQDVFYTEAALKAHYVFPAVTFAEKEGTFTNGERRVQKVYPGIEPYRNALADWKIIQMLSQLMGYQMDYPDVGAITKEIASFVPFYKGISHDADHAREETQWSGQDINFSFAPFLLKEPEKSHQGKFYLITGTAFFHSGTLSRYSGLNILGSKPWVEVNPEDAGKLGINQNDRVKLTSAEKEIVASAKVDPGIPPGVVFMPNNFREAKVYQLLGNQNYCLVEIKKG